MSAVFDHHQHVGRVDNIVRGMGGAPALGSAEWIEVEYATRVRAMDRLGIAAAALMPGHSYPRPRGLADTRAVNDQLAAYRLRDPRRFPAIVGTVEPRYGLAGLAEIERMAEMGFIGVSWHHRQQGLAIDHPVMVHYVRRMAALGLVPFIHAFVRGDFESLWRLRALAERFPETPILCLDSMSDPELCEETLAVGARVPNLLFDVAALGFRPAWIERFVDALGPERLLFGSNLYSMGAPDAVPELDAIRATRLSQVERDLILGGNARRLLKLEGA